MSESPPPPSADGSGAASAAERAPVRGWLWFLLVLVIAGAGWYHYDRYKERDALAQAEKKAAEGKKGFGKGMGGPTPVVAVPARKGRIDVYLDGLGTVTPLRTVTVRSRVDGQLMRVFFQEGERVEQGQLLAQIDPRPFEVMLKQAEGQLARDQALLANARLDVERYRTLLEQDSIAKQQVDAQEALVRQYEGVVKSDQSQVENARLQLSYARVTAPIAGRAGLRLIDPGNIVRAGDATGIVVITQLAPIGVLFTVPQDSLPALMKRVQSEERLSVEAWDREQKSRLAQGRLLAVDNLVDVATGTVKLKASFGNADNELFPNQFVNVRLKLDTLEEQTVIAQSAVQRGGRGLFVYVVKDDMTVSARPITLGAADGPRVAVLKGLEPGERVVTDGIDRLREGTRVQVAKRPEFKPSVDGTSGARKKGKGTGKAAESAAAPAGASAPGDKPAAATSGDAARAGPGAGETASKGPRPSASADAAAEDAPKKKRRPPPAEGEESKAPAGAPGSESGRGEEPPKKQRKPRPAADDARPEADAAPGPGSGSEQAPKKKGRRKPPPEGEPGAGASSAQ